MPCASLARFVTLAALATLLACVSGAGMTVLGTDLGARGARGAAASLVAPPSMQIPGLHDEAPAADEVVVVSWNVHVGGGDLTGLVHDLRAGRLGGAGPSPDAFVLLLQEVHRSGDGVLTTPKDDLIHVDPPSGERLDLATVAAALGLHVAYAPAMPNGRPSPEEPTEDRGVAIVSSHPLGDVEVVELPRERQRRVAIVATMRGRGADGAPWSLRVASAHLENRTSWSRLFGSFAARGRQARALVDALGPESVVLGADLNTWAPDFLEPALDVLAEHFPDSPWSAEGTHSFAGLSWPLDHLLFRLPGARVPAVSVLDDAYGSDHTPVMGVVPVGPASVRIVGG